MNLYQDIKRNRRLVGGGIVVLYAMTLAVIVLRSFNADRLDLQTALGTLALAVVIALPPTIAWLSLDRRPGLLPAAALAAVMVGFGASVFMPIFLIVAFLWGRAWWGRPVPVETSRPLWWARVALALGAFVALFMLFVHIDPVCTQTMADGSTVSIDAGSRGFQSGWRFATATTSFSQSTSGPVGAEVVSETCSSDEIVAGESLASLVVSALVVALATRWPTRRRTHGATESLVGGGHLDR